MNTNRAIRILLLPALPLIISGMAVAQTDQTITVKIVPAMTVEERVAADTKEKELRKAAEEKRIAEEAAKIAATSPKTLLGHAQHSLHQLVHRLS